jgi:hypothetical protein
MMVITKESRGAYVRTHGGATLFVPDGAMVCNSCLGDRRIVATAVHGDVSSVCDECDGRGYVPEVR